MAENYNGMAVGIFELDSFAACFVALDAASKAANVRIQNIERNRLGAGACVKMRGSVSDVTAAMEAAIRTAEPIAKVVSHTVIASPAHDTEPAIVCFAAVISNPSEETVRLAEEDAQKHGFMKKTNTKK